MIVASPSRRAALVRVQTELQRLWDLIESREAEAESGIKSDWYTARHIANMWAKYEQLEVKERQLLATGFTAEVQ